MKKRTTGLLKKLLMPVSIVVFFVVIMIIVAMAFFSIEKIIEESFPGSKLENGYEHVLTLRILYNDVYIPGYFYVYLYDKIKTNFKIDIVLIYNTIDRDREIFEVSQNGKWQRIKELPFTEPVFEDQQQIVEIPKITVVKDKIPI